MRNLSFGKIVSLYDFSAPGRAALRVAERLASRFRSRLEIVHVWEMGPTYLIGDWGHQVEPLKNILNRRLYRDVQNLSKGKDGRRPKSIKGILGAGDPKTAALEVLKDERPDLVVMGSHGRTGFQRFLMGSVAEKMVRRSPAPVWVVRKPPRRLPKRILVPVDFDESSRHAVSVAIELARRFSARVEIVHVVPMVENLAPFPEMQIYFPLTLTEDLRKNSRKRLERLAAEFLPSRIPVDLHVLTGAPADAICRRARSMRADLIVIPTHGRRGLAHVILGSVSQAVIRRAPCSTLTLPSRKKTR